MALQFVDRVAVYTATTGTGAITIGSAVAGYQTPAAAGATVGNTLYYTIEDGAAWEIGLGTYTSSTVFTRSTVLHSTNSNAAISLDGNAVLTLSNPAEVAYLFAQLSGAAFTGAISVSDPTANATFNVTVVASGAGANAGILLNPSAGVSTARKYLVARLDRQLLHLEQHLQCDPNYLRIWCINSSWVANGYRLVYPGGRSRIWQRN